MANEITKVVWRNGVRGKVAYDEASFTPITSATDLHDIVVAKLQSAGVTDAWLAQIGNVSQSGLGTIIATQAGNDNILV
jgi:hypothetical protein